MSGVLTILSGLLWWLLYASVGALFSALMAWVVLRWAERAAVVFNRTYYACLLWNLLGLLLLGAVAAHAGQLRPPYGALLASTALRASLVAQMLIGAALLWRLVPRRDAHRIRPASACLAVAVVTAVGFGVATSLA